MRCRWLCLVSKNFFYDLYTSVFWRGWFCFLRSLHLTRFQGCQLTLLGWQGISLICHSKWFAVLIYRFTIGQNVFSELCWSWRILSEMMQWFIWNDVFNYSFEIFGSIEKSCNLEQNWWNLFFKYIQHIVHTSDWKNNETF